MKNVLLKSSLVAVLAIGSGILSAAEPVHSPKGMANMTSTNKATSSGSLVGGDYKGAAAKAEAMFHRKVSGVANDADLVKGVPFTPGKNSSRPDSFQIAPARNK